MVRGDGGEAKMVRVSIQLIREKEASIITPTRIQRKRSAGWKMPPNAIYVGRPTIWGNPYKVDVNGSLEEVIAKYRVWLEEKLKVNPHFFDPLKGKDLACWCPLDKPCHADVLLEKLKLTASQLEEVRLSESGGPR